MKVAIDQLVVTDENPRHTRASESSHNALVASLSTHGLIQPIVVRQIHDNDNNTSDQTTLAKYEVIAGTRRLEAIRQLGWGTVDVVENDAEYGISELGAAENMMREAMHPLDECTVISRLVADGESIDAVAGRFGQTEKWVEQRMKLNALAPKVAAAFREGTITMAAAQAYTLVDRTAQQHYFGEGKKAHQLDAPTILSMFSKASYNAKNAMFPLEAYPQTQIRRDLFGDDVWLDDRKEFERLQHAAINALKEKLLKEEGWNDVLILWSGPDYTVTNKYVRPEGRILKADRSKYVVLVVYTPGSGHCVVDRGFVLRKDASKTQVGATPALDTANPEDVAAKTADELSATQVQILGALQTEAIEKAIAEGDVRLALLTLLGPLASYKEASPVWAAGRTHMIGYRAVNDMLTSKIEEQNDRTASYKIPSREDLEDMKGSTLAVLICNIALRSMQIILKPDKLATKELKALDVKWIRFDEGFLKRYRLDALQDLADRLKVDHDGLKKSELVDKILGVSNDDRDLSRIIKIAYE
jgi:ParB/RepB/Spo0J family partition protein